MKIKKLKMIKKEKKWKIKEKRDKEKVLYIL